MNENFLALHLHAKLVCKLYRFLSFFFLFVVKARFDFILLLFCLFFYYHLFVKVLSRFFQHYVFMIKIPVVNICSVCCHQFPVLCSFFFYILIFFYFCLWILYKNIFILFLLFHSTMWMMVMFMELEFLFFFTQTTQIFISNCYSL